MFHHKGKWSKSTHAQSIDVFDQALALLQQHSVEVIARGARLPPFQRQHGNTASPYVWEFSNLLERLNERLKDRGDYGIVIADQQAQYRQRLQRNLADGRENGTGGYRNQKLTRILDTAHFVDSQQSPMVQLADLVAFIMRRRACTTHERDARQEKVMLRLFNRIHAAIPEPRGQYHTIR